MEFIGAIFKPDGTAVQREILKKLKKLRKDVEPNYHAAEKIINDDARDVVDELPSFVPGVKLARDSKQWDAAKNEFSLQLANLDRAIDKLDHKLADLGGPNRAYSIDDILKRAQARRQQCVDELAERERNEQISCEVSCDHWFHPEVLGGFNRECRQDCDHAHPANRTP